MFIAHLIQSGEGCDYMISCGETTFTLPEEIKTMDEAETYIVKEYAGWLGMSEECVGCDEDCGECEIDLDDDYSEHSLSRISIYEVADSKKLDVKAIKAANKDRAKAQAAKAQEAKELAELKRLQEKHKGKV